MAAQVLGTYGGGTDATSTSRAIGITAGHVAAGDMLVVYATSRGHSASDAPCTISDNSTESGDPWTNEYTNTDRRVYIWWKRFDSAQSSVFSVTVAGAINSVTAVAVRVRGARPTTPLIERTVEFNNSGDETHASLADGTVPDNCAVLVSIHNVFDDHIPSSETFESVISNGIGPVAAVVLHRSTAGSDCSTEVGYVNVTTPPSLRRTGNFTWSQTNTTTITTLLIVAPDVTELAPAPVATTLAVTDSLVAGTTTFEPDPVAALLEVPDPDLQLVYTVSPDPVVLLTSVPEAEVTVPITLAPDPVFVRLRPFSIFRLEQAVLALPPDKVQFAEATDTDDPAGPTAPLKVQHPS